MASSLTRHSTYSYRYASDVVHAFVQKYARVLVLISYIYQVDKKELVEKLKYLFMKNNTKWNVVRDLLKRVQNREDMDYLRSLPRLQAQSYIHMLRSFAEDSVIEPENWE